MQLRSSAQLRASAHDREEDQRSLSRQADGERAEVGVAKVEQLARQISPGKSRRTVQNVQKRVSSPAMSNSQPCSRSVAESTPTILTTIQKTIGRATCRSAQANRSATHEEQRED